MKLRFSALLLIVLTMYAKGYSQAINVQDSLALVDFYNCTNGPDWNYQYNWLTKEPVSTWYGITVAGTGITKIDLNLNNLAGTIPTSIGDLTALIYLSLPNNHLSGSIPSSVGNLVNLQYIDLSFNQLCGSIPDAIGYCLSLFSILLNNNRLNGSIPATIGDLHLQSLYLDNNQLSGSIPSSIGNLNTLLYLGLGYNQLSGCLPVSIGYLKKVEQFDLSNNHLSGNLPSSFGKLSNLYIAFLNNNELSGDIPATFKKLENLAFFNLSHNQLSQSSNIAIPMADQQPVNLIVSYNNFTFNGLEFLAKKFRYSSYSPQAIIPIHQNGNTLSVYAGGTLSNNTYHWFRVGSTDSTTITGDSTFQPTQSGKYYARITNAIATQLTLYSDTIDFTMPVLAQSKTTPLSSIQANTITSHFSVYPNPARDRITINSQGKATFTLTNPQGKTILTQTAGNNSTIDVSHIPAGVYYITNTLTGLTQRILVSR